MKINEASGVPIWRQLADAITSKITAGELKVGDQVPSVRELAEEWGVAVSSAANALSELRGQGVIKTERGRGSYVAARPMLFRVGTRRYRHGDDMSPTTSELERQNNPAVLTGRGSAPPAAPHIAERVALR